MPGQKERAVKGGKSSGVKTKGSRKNVEARSTKVQIKPLGHEENPTGRGGNKPPDPLDNQGPDFKFHIHDRKTAKTSRLDNHRTGNLVPFTLPKEIKDKLAKFRKNPGRHVN